MGISKKALITGEDILSYIPQRAPIVMVDSYFGVEDGISVSQLEVRSDNIFSSKNGIFEECGVVEHIAQSAALRTGYIAISSGEKVPLGFIGAVENGQFYERVKVGDILTTSIEVEQEIFNITLISAKVECRGKKVAECRMKIALSSEK